MFKSVDFQASRYAARSLLHASLFVVALASACAAQSDPDVLSPQEIATIDAQKAEAEKISGRLNTRLMCLEGQEQTQQSRSESLQGDAGELHRAAQDLQVKFDAATSAKRGFEREFLDLQRQQQTALNRMATLRGELDARKAALASCKDKFGIIGFMCDFAGEITGLNGQIRELEPAVAVAKTNLDAGRIRLSAAQDRLDTAQAQLATAQQAVEKNRTNLRMTEAEIIAIKKALEALRSARFSYASELARFNSAYSEFQNLDEDDDPSFIVRDLRAASEEMEDALPHARAVLRDNGLVLPSGARVCAN